MNTVDKMDIYALLDKFVLRTREAFKSNLTGIYLHGSLAMGCFYERKSDVDLIVVVNRPLTMDEKRAYIKEIISINKKAPEKGIEMSVVLKRDMNPFCHPAPFEMHFSNAHLDNYIKHPDETLLRMTGTDRDLAAHVTIINHYGKTLFGEDKKDVFSKVKNEDYLDALLYDLENAREDILENPMYVTFSLCRVLAYVLEGKALSKKEGGEWALKHVDEKHHEIIKSALHAYETDEGMKVSGADAQVFTEYMLTFIHTAIGR